MKVHLIKEATVVKYMARHAAGAQAFWKWLYEVKSSDWKTANDIKKIPGTDLLGNGSDRVVFDIGGNNYRLIAKYDFAKEYVHLYIKWIGTHAEYTKLCKAGKQYTINDF